MKKRDVISVALLIVLLAIVIIREQDRTYSFKRVRILMDTSVEVELKTPNKQGAAVLDSVFTLIENYDKCLSFYKEGSLVQALNNNPADSVAIGGDIYALLKVADDLYKKSGGLYDVTTGNLSLIWDFDSKIVPKQATIDSALALTGFDNVRYGPGWVKRPYGLKLDFGSVAKGYIIDKAIAYLQSTNLVEAIVNAGGDIRIVYGPGVTADSVAVGVRHPRQPGQLIDTLYVAAKAVVTSGDYERFFIADSIRYHHILNPKTGYPAQGTISVTIIAPDAATADALATACFAMPPQQALDMVKQIDKTAVMIYYQGQDGITCLKNHNMAEYLHEKP